MATPSNILKHCSSCGIDVSTRKRWKDSAGKYYCEPCWMKQNAARSASVSAPADGNRAGASIDDLEEISLEPSKPAKLRVPKLSCAGCGTELGWNQAHDHNGKPYCFDCITESATAAARQTQLAPVRPSSAPSETQQSYDLVSTRRCPYCDEEIQATAKKCKHCGEWLNERSSGQVLNYRGNNVRQRSTTVGAPARSYLNSAILTLILYVVGLGITGLIANFVYLSSARRMEEETGVVPEGKGCLVALLWVFFWIPLIVVAVIVMLLMISDMYH